MTTNEAHSLHSIPPDVVERFNARVKAKRNRWLRLTIIVTALVGIVIVIWAVRQI